MARRFRCEASRLAGCRGKHPANDEGRARTEKHAGPAQTRSTNSVAHFGPPCEDTSVTANVHGKKAVLVTGASSGIGLGIARKLLGSGFRVFGSVRSKEQAEN